MYIIIKIKKYSSWRKKISSPPPPGLGPGSLENLQKGRKTQKAEDCLL